MDDERSAGSRRDAARADAAPEAREIVATLAALTEPPPAQRDRRSAFVGELDARLDAVDASPRRLRLGPLAGVTAAGAALALALSIGVEPEPTDAIAESASFAFAPAAASTADAVLALAVDTPTARADLAADADGALDDLADDLPRDFVAIDELFLADL